MVFRDALPDSLQFIDKHCGPKRWCKGNSDILFLKTWKRSYLPQAKRPYQIQSGFDINWPPGTWVCYAKLICNNFNLLGDLDFIDISPKSQLCDTRPPPRFWKTTISQFSHHSNLLLT
jgi:hypothetical protein